MNEGGVYIGVVVKLHTGFEEVESFSKKCSVCNITQHTGSFCCKCGKELEKQIVNVQKDYRKFLSDEDAFYELPVESENEKGISYLISNTFIVDSELDLSHPVNILNIDWVSMRYDFVNYYHTELERLSDAGFEWSIEFMAIEWQEY